VLTDCLDIDLGLHRYVFLNLGRVHPSDVHPVYFVFPNKLLLSEGVVVALREIVHFGSLVSQERVDLEKSVDSAFTDELALAQNIAAAKSFFSNVYSGSVFRSEVFPKFLEKNYPRVINYSVDINYPGSQLELVQLGGEAFLKNCWEGPQVMVPSCIPLADYRPAILITDTGHEQTITRQLEDRGLSKNRIFSMSEVSDIYQERYKSWLGPYGSQLNTATYVNLALRDIALLSRYNEDQKDFPNSMVGFKSRLNDL